MGRIMTFLIIINHLKIDDIDEDKYHNLTYLMMKTGYL